MRSWLVVPAVLLATSLSSAAQAHRPSFAYGFYGTMDTAFPVRDPQESIVVNHTATCERQAVWLRFKPFASGTRRLTRTRTLLAISPMRRHKA